MKLIYRTAYMNKLASAMGTPDIKVITFNPIVSFGEQAVKDELRELVRKTIEETINAMLDEEADQLVGAGPYERTDERAAYRAGHYERGFTTTSGQLTLKMPKLKGMRFATAVIERYKRRESRFRRVYQ